MRWEWERPNDGFCDMYEQLLVILVVGCWGTLTEAVFVFVYLHWHLGTLSLGSLYPELLKNIAHAYCFKTLVKKMFRRESGLGEAAFAYSKPEPRFFLWRWCVEREEGNTRRTTCIGCNPRRRERCRVPDHCHQPCLPPSGLTQHTPNTDCTLNIPNDVDEYLIT